MPGSSAGNFMRRFFGVLRNGLPVLLILCILTVSGYAWFSAFRVSDNVLTFRTGGISYPEITMWTYLTKEESSDGGKWEEQDVTADPDDGGRKIPAIGATEESGSYSISIPNLHFGTIDNLLTVKNDNTVYFRIKIDRASFGDKCTLNVGMAATAEGEYSFTLYDGSKAEGDKGYTLVPSTDGAYNTVQEILSGSTGGETPTDPMPMLTFEYFVSSDEYEPDAIEALLHPASGDPLEMNVIEDGEAEIVNTDTTTETYYIYLRITPALETFVKISKQLYQYMPCVILYDANITISAQIYAEEP